MLNNYIYILLVVLTLVTMGFAIKNTYEESLKDKKLSLNLILTDPKILIKDENF